MRAIFVHLRISFVMWPKEKRDSRTTNPPTPHKYNKYPKNINNNQQGFLETQPMPKSLVQINCNTMYMSHGILSN